VAELLKLNWFFVALLAFVGLYCLLVSRNLLRLLIGIEILSKACILALISCGGAIGKVNTAQTLVITMIVVEVVVVAVALGLIIRSYGATNSIDMWRLNKLKD
jgi:NADH:ubiquinone oxidoreductase subunit K